MNDCLPTKSMASTRQMTSIFMFEEILEVMVERVQNFMPQILHLSHGDTMTLCKLVNLWALIVSFIKWKTMLAASSLPRVAMRVA